MSNRKRNRSKKDYLIALVANGEGEIFELAGYAAVGRSGPLLMPLTVHQTQPMPYGGELMYLPDRSPALYNLEADEFQILAENPYAKGETIYPVAAFNSPGYIQAHMSAFSENEKADARGWSAATPRGRG